MAGAGFSTGGAGAGVDEAGAGVAVVVVVAGLAAVAAALAALFLVARMGRRCSLPWNGGGEYVVGLSTAVATGSM